MIIRSLATVDDLSTKAEKLMIVSRATIWRNTTKRLSEVFRFHHHCNTKLFEEV
jgi:hypothetical protein